MPELDSESKNRETKVKVYESLREKSRNLGQIMKNYPGLQSNSPALYVLAYLKELGSGEV